ncbi:MAG: hypothetical protein ACRELV_02810 [Longimicrobiales bacterium]
MDNHRIAKTLSALERAEIALEQARRLIDAPGSSCPADIDAMLARLSDIRTRLRGEATLPMNELIACK